MMSMEAEKLLLKQVFGESSDSDGYDEEPENFSVCGDQDQPAIGYYRTWDQIKEVQGLWLCRDFLSPQQQSKLLSAIHNEGWFTETSHNQAMRFGDLPSWATQIADSINEMVLSNNDAVGPMSSKYCNDENVTCLFPSDVWCREPLFDQLIANAYQPGEGICAHVDLMRFEDGIAIVSLESSCVMHFTRVDEPVSDTASEGKLDARALKVPLYLNPGSLVILWGDARYLWKHEINRKPGFQMWEGLELIQGRRVSITLRKLCQVE